MWLFWSYIILYMTNWLWQKRKNSETNDCKLWTISFLQTTKPLVGINAKSAILQNNIHKYANAIISNGWYNKHVIIFIYSVYFFPSSSFILVAVHGLSTILLYSLRVEKFQTWNVPSMCDVRALCLFIIVICS